MLGDNERWRINTRVLADKVWAVLDADGNGGVVEAVSIAHTALVHQERQEL